MRRLQQALLHRFSDRTIVIVAHRLTALERVDRRLVLNNGTIEAEGTHADLLRSSPVYRDLFRRSS